MKRIIVVCEGETEKEFCNTILTPYFAKIDIYLQAPLIKKSMGGMVKWLELKKQITLHLRNDANAFVTTLIDYYGLYSKYQFPKWEESEKIADKNLRMQNLELGMKDDIESSLRFRFIPYLQLHEFEGLLFNDITIFQEQIPPDELIGVDELKQVFKEYDNPEMINNNNETSPSHRLARIILGYNKIVYGHILAEAIGLDRMRAKSPRFNNWIERLETLWY
ncbi:DUF4276 family protein [Roseimarinus sediminis]|uniref:DUF4276 family protein n=1 Tax=Roseimarinus sediminis TaxID=1610899 RepID=UPI003D232043